MNLTDREQALIALVRDYQADECRAILETARAEAGRLTADAYRRERARLHARVVAERANARARIQAVRAERDTRARASCERANAKLLALAWPRLLVALQARWLDPRMRRAWIGAALEQARASLPQGRWTIRHPPDWDATERAEVSARLSQDLGQAPAFLSDGRLRAGLAIKSQDAMLDISLDGLVHDRRRLEARLLALMTSPARARQEMDG